ncbi:MAG: pyridoxal 5'-phosphate synthase glutaminase subunit PdxT [Trueperaceae bacterium]
MNVGVLALQGAFREHRRAFERLGANVSEVRLPDHLKGLSAVVIPGGESTTMAKLMLSYGLDQALHRFHDNGGAVWGTCAGAIAVASDIVGRPEQPTLGLIDMTVERNSYGRQIASFEADLEITGLVEGPFHAVFIRAPRLVRVGPGVEVLGSLEGDPVIVRQGRLLAGVFHPELSGDDRVHRYFLEQVAAAVAVTG